MAGGLSSLVVLVLSSYMLVGGQNCSLTVGDFHFRTVTASAESVGGSTPGARVTWSTTIPPECVTSVRVEFKTTSRGPVVATYNTTNTSETEVIQTGLQCGTYYHIGVEVTAELRPPGGMPTTQILSLPELLDVQVFVGDIPVPVRVRAEVTVDNTSIRVSWQWSHEGVPMCVALVRVHYDPEGGSLMMFTVNNTIATSATLPSLQCNTEYTIWVHASRGGLKDTRSDPIITPLPARAPPTPTGVTAQLMNVSSVRVEWQWTSSGPAPSCFNTTRVTYHPEGGGESSLQLSDPAGTEATLTNLQCNTNYTITVVAIAGEHRTESVARTVFVPLKDIPTPVGVTAEVTADNTSVKVSWEWSRQGVPTCIDNVTVHYQPEGGSPMMYTVDNATTTSATLSNLKCSTNYTIWVHARGGLNDTRSSFTLASLPARAPPTPTEVTAEVMNVSFVRVAWQWSSSGPAPNCFNTTHVTYHPEEGDETSLQLSDPAATEATLTDLQCNTNYTITVVATAGEHGREGAVLLPLQGPQNLAAAVLSATSVHLTWVAPCHAHQYHIYYRGTCGAYVDEGRLGTDHQEHTFDGLQEGLNYSFTITQTGFSGGRLLSTGPVHAKTIIVGNIGMSSICPEDSGEADSDEPESSSILSLVAGVAVSAVVLVLAAVCIVVVVVWWRHRRGNGKDAAVELADMADSNSVDSKEEQDADIFVDNSCYEQILTSPPTIVDYQREVQCLEGEQVSLMVKATGSPTPTVSWFFNGRKVEDDYSTELGKDGSLVLVSVEAKHAGTYTFTVSNRVGSVEGRTKLVVCTEDEECASVLRVKSNPVTREKFGEYVSSFHAHNNGAFIGQFMALPSGEEGHQTTVGKTPANSLLNRFKNIAPYDDDRVVLESISDGVDCEHDYINATYIDCYSQSKKYIATQGPLPNTTTDFWWLVWQEQVHIVAMVTNTMERGQQKCEQYWPNEGTKEYGPFKVMLTDQQVFADYTIRQLFVSCGKVGGNPLKVTQFHFTSWPDHGVPEYAGPILNYLCRMKAQMKLSWGPTLVHCSAGIGRTGTLMAIDMALEQATLEDVVDIPAIVIKMRRQRMKMVQNSDQYVFIHDAVLESLTCGDTQIPASGLSGAIEKLKEKDSETGRTGFETQFHVLGQVTPKPTEVIRASAIRFPDLNRSLDFLPPENWRVTLKGEIKDYIHASFANGYKHRRGFIIAQAPMKSTCRDFWKMVYERECGVIVMLSDLVENGEEVCYQYWPADDTNGVQKYGEFTVSVLQATKQDGFMQRNISITNPKSGQEHKVTQFQMSCWTPEGLCTSPPAIMAVIEHMLVIQRRTGNKPIVVHGSDTVSRCGVFCSFINATECCKTEGIVDVFQVVKALRIQKPGSVLTVEQYRFIFDLMLLFLESFNIYSNFK